MRRCVFALLMLGVVVAAPATWAKQSAPRYYVALGDSLSVGVQPDQRGVERKTDQGYADQLAAFERARIPSLRLVKFGCPGDTTTGSSPATVTQRALGGTAVNAQGARS